VEEENGMSSFRWTWVVAIGVAALVAFTIFDSKRSSKEAEAKKQESSLFKFKSADIKKIEISTIFGEKTLERKTPDHWQLLQPIEDSADDQVVNSLLSTFAAEKSLSTITENADPKNDTTYGFDAPISKVKLTASDGRTEELKVGRVKAYDGSLYVRIDNDPKVLLAGQALGNQIDKPALELRDKHLYRPKEGGDTVKITRFEIRQDDPTDKTLPAEIDLAKDGDNWKITKGLVGDSDYPVLNDKVQAYIDQVKATRALSYNSDSPKGNANGGKKSGDKKTNGLDKLALDIRFYSDSSGAGASTNTSDGKKAEPFFRIDFAAPDATLKGKAPEVDAKSSDVSSIAKVYKSGFESMKKHVDDFLDKKYPFDFKKDAVSKIKVMTGDGSLEFVRKGIVWELADPSLHKDVDSAKVAALVEKLHGIEAVRILEPLKKDQKSGLKSNPMLKNASSIILSQDSGEPVFEFFWGDAIIEKASAGKPESKYYPARTSRVDRMVGVSEFSIRGLELGDLIKKPQVAPSPKPSVGSAPLPSSSP
jgi:hypothetical protein